MLALQVPDGPLKIACLGAHPDDIEIGCGGTLLELAERRAIHARFVVMTGSAERRIEARGAAAAFLPNSEVDFFDFHDGRLPGQWDGVKRALSDFAGGFASDIVMCPRVTDAHQDHRLLGELAPTVWRDCPIFEYEIPKWDGDLAASTHYVPLQPDTARKKMAILNRYFVSQLHRDWWDDETFLGLMRLRGMECRERYAEAFVVRKTVIKVVE